MSALSLHTVYRLYDGWTFTLATDHKPLLSLFNEKTIPA